jgi:putative MFS transporter
MPLPMPTTAPLPEATPAGGGRTALTGYQKKLMAFLSVATFFEGFDFFALAQILPQVQRDFAISDGQVGWLVGVANVGPILAYLLVRKADVWGRRPVLALTIAGYTLFTVASALAPSAWSFAACQLVARLFLIGEWSVAMIFAAEEYPADRRGLVLGVIQGFSYLGGIVCSAVVPLLLRTPLGWRSVYLVGGVPLVIIAFARRRIQETRRFQELAAGPRRPAPDLFAIWRTPWRGRLLLLACIWGATYACNTAAVLFWKLFATRERGLTDGQVGLSMSAAALVAMPLVFLVGRLLDGLGRRRGAVIIYAVSIAGVAGAYLLHGRLALTVALALGMFGTSAVLPLLNAYTTELVPTSARSDAFAWANNLLGRLSPVVAPPLIGAAAAAYGWGPSVAATVLGPALALCLVLVALPETTRRELEETSAL